MTSVIAGSYSGALGSIVALIVFAGLILGLILLGGAGGQDEAALRPLVEGDAASSEHSQG